LIFISDIHHGLSGLKELPIDKGPLVILGDLINWIDYRDGSGIARDVFGDKNVDKLITYRKNHDFSSRKDLWKDLFADDPENKQVQIEEAVELQYEDVFRELGNHEVWIIPGNVDSISIMKKIAGDNIEFVDGKIIEYEGIKFGFAGGGVPTPINARGELSEQEFNQKLNSLSEVDIICTHAPPLVDELVTDVITDKIEQGWTSLLQFIEKNKPIFCLFGDVHQAKATRWLIGETKCINVGYNRATKKYLDLKDLTNG